MRYEHETCTKITPKEYAIIVASKNYQDCEVFHIILHIRHNITWKHRNWTIIEISFIHKVEPSHSGVLIVYQARPPFSPDDLYLLSPHAKKGSSKGQYSMQFISTLQYMRYKPHIHNHTSGHKWVLDASSTSRE